MANHPSSRMRTPTLLEPRKNFSMGLRSLHAGAKLALFHLYLAIAVAKQLGHEGSTNENNNGGSLTQTDEFNSHNLRDFQRASFEDSFGPPLGDEFEKFDSQSWIINGERKLLSALSKRERSTDDSRQHVQPETQDFPDKYILFVKLGPSADVLDNSMQAQLRNSLSRILNIPLQNVIIKDIKPRDGLVELYFVKEGHQLTGESDLMLARHVEMTIASMDMTGILSTLEVQEVFTQDGVDRAVLTDTVMGQPYMPYILSAAGIILITGLAITIWCYLRHRKGKSDLYSTRSSPSPPAHIPRQICLYPSAKPSVNHATLIQPDVTQIYTNKSCGECGTPVHTPPMRIKKGLLERRGSNASLTLDLGPQNETKPTWGSPPRESSAEEYLLSAGNRMSRKELRNCLRNTKMVYEEFWEIPMNHPDKVEVAGCGMKNRYRTIIPNEHSRVVLPETDSDPLTTYINANFIRGYAAEPKAYIATQGPMAHTVNDFWKMIWTKQVPIIVMITKLKEKNKTKCECYLPEGHDVFGDIEVTVLGTIQRDGYILRQLHIKCDGEHHTLLHYWYTAWPDHKAPNTARQLLELVREVDRQRYDPATGQVKGPVVVHCSAGIGRTGCFIAASIGVLQLREEHMVDILGIVCSMRLDRGGMVQTNEQYEFVHQALCLYEKELPDRPPSGE